MTDDDTLTAVRDCLTAARDRVAGEQLARPAGAIISRSRCRRLRQGLSTAVAAAVIVAVVASAQLPGSGGQGAIPVRLAAWTVIHQPGGQIAVTIRELRDLAGLQRQLRADGVPALVQFSSFGPRSAPRHHPCVYPGHFPPARRDPGLMGRILPQRKNASRQIAFTINPSAIPAHIGLWIRVKPPPANSDVFLDSMELIFFGACKPGKRVAGHTRMGAVPSPLSAFWLVVGSGTLPRSRPSSTRN